MKPIVLVIAVSLAPAGASAQSHAPWRPAGVADQHRYEMDRLRAVSERNEALARQQRMETWLTIQQLQAARQPAPYVEPPVRLLRSPEEERAAREAAQARRRGLVEETGQIDAWLDRAPR